MDIVKLDTVQLYNHQRGNMAVGALVHWVACQLLVTVLGYLLSIRVQWLGIGRAWKGLDKIFLFQIWIDKSSIISNFHSKCQIRIANYKSEFKLKIQIMNAISNIISLSIFQIQTEDFKFRNITDILLSNFLQLAIVLLDCS